MTGEETASVLSHIWTVVMANKVDAVTLQLPQNVTEDNTRGELGAELHHASDRIQFQFLLKSGN